MSHEDETLYMPPLESDDEAPSLAADLAAAVAQHVVVPLLTIVLVGSFLFYLLDVRSVFLLGSARLKWIGLCFVVATVLTARFGAARGSEAAERQGCYTLALAGATLLAMTVGPAAADAGAAGTFANLVIVALTWRFATRLTRGLSLDEAPQRPVRRRFYGLERLGWEAWRRRQGEEIVGDEGPDAHGHPGPAVVRWVLIALAAFALGEPLLLAGPPEVGERALAAMILFLFAAGGLLAAASAVGAYRLVESQGGRASLHVVPVRLAAGLGLAVLLLTAGLALPGLRFRGSGELAPVPKAGAGAPGGDAGESAEVSEPAGNEGRDGGMERRVGDASSSSSGAAHGAAAFLAALASLGGLLRWPLLLAGLMAAAFLLARLWPLLGKRTWRQRLDIWLAVLRAWAVRFLPAAAHRHRDTAVDPLAAPEELLALPPREAVITAYARLLAAFDRVSPRPAQQTPYELLDALPLPWRRHRTLIEKLTSLYVTAAYSNDEVGNDARRQAITVLAQLGRQRDDL